MLLCLTSFPETHYSPVVVVVINRAFNCFKGALLLFSCCHPPVPPQISECEGSAPAWVSDTNHPQYAAARTATQVVYGQDPDLTREGGSIPITITLQVRCLKQLTTHRPFAATVKGTDPKFYSKIAKKKFFVEKAFSGMGEMRPKILGDYEY